MDDRYPVRCPSRGSHGPDDCPVCEPLPTDAQVDAMLAELAPDMAEFEERQMAIAREEY